MEILRNFFMLCVSYLLIYLRWRVRPDLQLVRPIHPTEDFNSLQEAYIPQYSLSSTQSLTMAHDFPRCIIPVDIPLPFPCPPLFQVPEPLGSGVSIFHAAISSPHPKPGPSCKARFPRVVRGGTSSYIRSLHIFSESGNTFQPLVTQ